MHMITLNLPLVEYHGSESTDSQGIRHTFGYYHGYALKMMNEHVVLVQPIGPIGGAIPETILHDIKDLKYVDRRGQLMTDSLVDALSRLSKTVVAEVQQQLTKERHIMAKEKGAKKSTKKAAEPAPKKTFVAADNITENPFKAEGVRGKVLAYLMSCKNPKTVAEIAEAINEPAKQVSDQTWHLRNSKHIKESK